MKKSVRIFWRIFLFGFLGFVLLVLMANFGVFGEMPSMKELENPSILQSSEVYAEDGTLMGKYYLPEGNRSVVKYRDISPHVVNALIATEDKRFYDHSGIDLKGTMRAVLLLGSKGGGSTITQQLALALFNRRATNKAQRMMQKLKEWIISVKLERNFTKEEIIALYLNAVPFSDNVFGIRNASRTFFQKEPDVLTVEEAALLVGMINGPGVYNPRRNPVPARDRRNLVLTRMEENGNITAAEATRYRAMPIKLNYRKLDENTGYAPYFREILREEVKNELKKLKKPDGSSYNIYEDGLKIYTTINPRMQEYAEEAMASQVPNLQKALLAQSKVKNGSIWKDHENVLEREMKRSDRWKNGVEDNLSDKEIKASFFVKTPMKVFAWNKQWEKDTVMTPYDSIKYHRTMVQSAFMVMDPVTGEVKAWVGGINFKTYKLDHANLNTKRQVGSSIKPLLYTQAMEERGFTPETEVVDQQQSFGNGQLVPATSRSCSGRTMTMANALAWSKNCATAYIMKQVGVKEFTDFIARLNIPTKVEAFPSIALGSCELSLFEMMWGYTIFAGRGFSTRPYFISRIEDRNGNVIKRFDYSANRKEVISEITAYKMARMMQGTVDKGTAAGLRGRLGAAEMAGKTGTTNDNSDAWFMGYTPQLLGGVWVGCDDRFIRNEGSGGFGGAAARPIWENFFKKVYADKKLGIERDAKFVQPAQMDNEMFSADALQIDSDIEPGAQQEDVGVGTEEGYDLPAESRPFQDPDAPVNTPKKDSTQKKDPKKDPNNKPIGSAADEPRKKKGLFKKLFGKKEN
ncbi:MAG: peptidoglycan glycosyltransferase [Sphingobacteriales bacterium SCN 48-20]|jgi:penicillin-binding protein 1A|uniref:penicillin-binding protein 1A n=1 Tax=Terrimonas ferruginea TaxID=249 RepID=UPI00086A08BD|nr:transglycosylase domain-containing protein [Terrimonas ferruginea]MBN8781932.1 transglycosylase domain-containing protein [Terrimonas ferruginea]ODT93380.1 MAG: peptidoglycan glycosyltransferase [Sphingobacteriales bacterium SCN 48-20]OJW45066.1 MAG: peptidoglycan glycosyltransferase [Sphingobacteriales bacterium 48-107]